MDVLRTCGLMLMLIGAAAVREAEILPVNLGENVTLPCHGDANHLIALVEWTRPDLESPEYVFFYRDERAFTSYQHRSFVDRVALKDKEMNDGDVSLILSNVSSTDVGVYECRVLQGQRSRSERSNVRTEPVRVISLEVEDGGIEGNVLHLGAAASLTLVVVVVILVLVLKFRPARVHHESQ